MKIYIASDHGGFKMKEFLKLELTKSKHTVVDLGCESEDSVDYPLYADLVCEKVSEDSNSRGILVCGTGIGMSIAANKHKNIRAALVSDVFSAIATREHNNTNVLCLGQRVIGFDLALLISNFWLDTEYTYKDKHQRRIEMMER